MTDKAREFERHNAQFLVVRAEVLTKNKERVYTQADMENIGFVRYWFNDSSIRTLSTDDSKALSGVPRWMDA